MATNNLKIVLSRECDGVEGDFARVMMQYERVVDEDSDFSAMFNLTNLSDGGCDRVEQNTIRAMSLYERAIQEGSHHGTVNNAANVLIEGSEDAERDVDRLVSLYERAIEEGLCILRFSIWSISCMKRLRLIVLSARRCLRGVIFEMGR